MEQTAVVIGATGATGKEVVNLLLKDSTYSKVVVLVRKSTGITDAKLIEHIIDFDQLDTAKDLVNGTVLFSCLGTTMAIAKTKEKQYTIDFHYQYNIAKIASENGVQKYVLISSIGASSKSSNFYLKMKGELDDAVVKLPFESVSIMRPGPIDAFGKRPENRSMESSSIKTLRFVNKLGLFKKYAPITTVQLATAMLKVAASNTTIKTYDSLEIFSLLK